MIIAQLQCHAGVSGDMFLSSLIDAGLPVDELYEMLAGVGVTRDELVIEKCVKKGISSTSLKVEPAEDRQHLHVADIRKTIGDAMVSETVARRALAVFERIVQAEAKVHRVDMEHVHLHEVSGLDTIVDILGVSWGIEQLGIEKLYSTPVNVGSGTVKISHGVVPVPAPATALILKDIPIVNDGLPGERATPTGAALIAEFVDEFTNPGSFKINKLGYGAGSLDSGDRANVLRILIGELTNNSAETNDSLREDLVMLETDIDDETPEIMGYVLSELHNLDSVLDASIVQTIRKKNRPGFLLRVLAVGEGSGPVREWLFSQTSTLGIREIAVRRYCRQRQVDKVETQWGMVRVIKSEGTCSPEFEDCKKIAEANDLPLRDVYNDVIRKMTTN